MSLKQRKCVSLLCATVLAGCSLAQTGDAIDGTAIFLAHSDANAAASIQDRCSLIRKGVIDEQRGPNKGPDLGHFSLLSCPQVDAEDRKSIEKLMTGIGDGISAYWIAGHFNQLESNRASPDADIDRAYVIKLSHINGQTELAPREAEEDAIDVMAATRPTGWTREARVYVTHAAGIKKPDVVGVLYFASAENRSQFRLTEKDVVERISAFNKRHLSEYVYLYGAATRLNKPGRE